MAIDIVQYNARWLQAWTDKDVGGLLTFYASDVIYKDPQVPAGLRGHEALRTYLTGLFAATPAMRYDPDETWPTHNGFCGRWICTIDGPDGKAYLRGFDLVVLDGDRITLNEVYTHTLAEKPASA
ncbi:MAG: nuclear transport factor 2 family protein [Candidatus Binataceae bacterium]